MAYLRMRKILSPAPIDPPRWPDGLRLVPFNPHVHPAVAHALLAEAYAQGGGSVPPFAEWWPALETDSEYDPALCFVVQETGQCALAAFAQCWTSGFIKDIAVTQNHRRKGLARVLLTEIFRSFQARGQAHVDLKVEVANPSGAVAFYRAMGMTEIT